MDSRQSRMITTTGEHQSQIEKSYDSKRQKKLEKHLEKFRGCAFVKEEDSENVSMTSFTETEKKERKAYEDLTYLMEVDEKIPMVLPLILCQTLERLSKKDYLDGKERKFVYKILSLIIFTVDNEHLWKKIADVFKGNSALKDALVKIHEQLIWETERQILQDCYFKL